MSLPAFILRPGHSRECICTHCFLTVRIDESAPTLEEAQKQHVCGGEMDLKAIRNQA